MDKHIETCLFVSAPENQIKLTAKLVEELKRALRMPIKVTQIGDFRFRALLVECPSKNQATTVGIMNMTAKIIDRVAGHIR